MNEEDKQERRRKLEGRKKEPFLQFLMCHSLVELLVLRAYKEK
jgi:hypothetical protein